MSASVYDNRGCFLGEGPLWHPERGQLFWFDIINCTLMTVENGEQKQWTFDEKVSAAGWVDKDTLLIASETSLSRLDLISGERRKICDLEADNPVTRSNDGRADPWGGFWIGTMGKSAEAGAGSIYRFYKGELRRLVPNVTITNAICFSPDRRSAYFADTDRQIVWRQPLADSDGWPVGEADEFLDLSNDGLYPDGAVVDSQGNFWNAQWGASRVACYAPDGSFLRAIEAPAAHTSCPAFGGEHFNQLFVTTAQQGLSNEALANQPSAGMVHVASCDVTGQAEHRVIL